MALKLQVVARPLLVGRAGTPHQQLCGVQAMSPSRWIRASLALQISGCLREGLD